MARSMTRTMTRRTRIWISLVLLALVAAALAWRGQQAWLPASDPTPEPAAREAMVELGPLDVARAQTRLLQTRLPISGTLKAVHSARVKARVPGELQDLQVREGDTVEAGQVIARVKPVEYSERLRQAEQQAQAARAQVDIAQRQYDNNRALVDEGFISPTALETSAANLEAARANLRAAQAGTEVARQSLLDTTLKAPISGQIAQRLAQPGERVSPEAPIVEIIDPSALELEAAINPANSLQLRLGQQALLQVEGASEPVQATVARINPSAQAGSRSVLAYLAVQTQPGLRHGLFAEGTLATGEQQALAVPLAAVRTDKPLPYVQRLDADSKPARVVHQPVTPGVRTRIDDRDWVAVNGLSEGQLVLLPSAGSLAEGTPVQLPAQP